MKKIKGKTDLPPAAGRQTKPAARKPIGPKAWLANVRKKNPRRQNEEQTAYARRLHVLMQEANLTKPWSLGTLRRRLYEK